MDLGVTKDERTYGMWAHLSAISGYTFLPFGQFLGPIIFWQLKKELPFVDDQGKEALNFQITVTLAMFVASLTLFIGIGAFILGALVIYAVAMAVIAGVKANGGVTYRYPLTLRLLK